MQEAPKDTRHWWSALLIGGTLAWLFQESLLTHIRRAVSPIVFNDDARQQIAPFYRYSDPALFPTDYIGDFFLRRTPLGVRGLYMAGAYLWDAERVSKYLPYFLLAIVLVALGMATRRLAGWTAVFFALAFGLSSSEYLHHMSGGLARAFGFPMLSVAALALVQGRMTAVAVCVVVATALYPSAAVPIGLALAVVVLVFPAASRGQAAAWSPTRRLLVVLGTAAAAALAMLPSQVALRQYGRMLRPTDLARYPEIGPHGRNERGNRPPFAPLTKALPRSFDTALLGRGVPIFPPLHSWFHHGTRRAASARERVLLIALAVVTIAGSAILLVTDPAARRLLTLVPAIFLLYDVARQAFPYLYIPRRFLMYGMPVLTAIFLPAAAAALPRLLPRRLRHPLAPSISVALVCGFALLALGGRGDGRGGLAHSISPTTNIYVFVAGLPPNALIAGWPHEVIDNVPYFSRRQPLLTFEGHDAFYEGYANEMRRRMQALIAAYFALDLKPLLDLRDHFGVTHLIVDATHYGRTPPRSFEPFTQSIRTAWRRGGASNFETLRHPEAQVFSEGTLFILDLQRLHGSGGIPSD